MDGQKSQSDVRTVGDGESRIRFHWAALVGFIFWCCCAPRGSLGLFEVNAIGCKISDIVLVHSKLFQLVIGICIYIAPSD